MGYFHDQLLRPLLLPGEGCRRFVRRSQVWGSRKLWFRWWPACRADRGTLLLTDRSFFYITGEPPLSRTGGFQLSHNLVCFSLRVPSRAEYRPESSTGGPGVGLLLTWGGEGGRDLEILFPAEEAPRAEQLAREWSFLAGP